MIDDYQFVAVVFDGEDTASDALSEIKALRKDGSVKYKDAVAAYKKNGKVKLVQTKESRGIFGGGTLGLVLGWILGGPVIGAAIGALVGGLSNKGLNNKDMKAALEDFDDDESVLFLLIDDADWTKMDNALPEYKAVLYREVVPVEVVASFEKASENYETAKALDEELETEKVE
jgi:uncharacterized membrane protein